MKDNQFVFVIPYFNCHEDIEKTIYSTVSQTYDNWKAVLINDLSSDETRDVAVSTIGSLPKKIRDKFTHIE